MSVSLYKAVKETAPNNGKAQQLTIFIAQAIKPEYSLVGERFSIFHRTFQFHKLKIEDAFLKIRQLII